MVNSGQKGKSKRDGEKKGGQYKAAIEQEE